MAEPQVAENEKKLKPFAYIGPQVVKSIFTKAASGKMLKMLICYKKLDYVISQKLYNCKYHQ